MLKIVNKNQDNLSSINFTKIRQHYSLIIPNSISKKIQKHMNVIMQQNFYIIPQDCLKTEIHSARTGPLKQILSRVTL